LRPPAAPSSTAPCRPRRWQGGSTRTFRRHDIPNIVPITEELIAAHGLKPEEYQRILDLIGREPSFTELGIFSAMWNEHCSYKSSKKWLRTLPTEGPQ
jgi:phosphoribosylformylglycinamidine (FGAM) synthase-like enzyme